MSIKILPARLANQIAAGEVVERPASVLKELLENSIDAGATQIEIDIEKGGHKKIKITDNGSGIVKDELTLALSRHATSKVADLDDLENICTLGFRGEALASISSVSRLTLTSRTAAQSEAWQARTEGREMQVVIEPAAHPVGTSVEVLDLFFNTPARRKFLRTEKTEFNHIEELFNRIALSRYDVGLRLKHNGKVLKNLPAIAFDDDPLKRVKQLCGASTCDEMLEIDGQYEGFRLKGWLSGPGHYRAMNDMQYVFVNNRMMRDKLIFHAIRQSYEGLLPDDKFPFFILYLEVPHKDVDVNVHPAKHEVRFHQSRLVHDFIFSIINDGLGQAISSKSSRQSNEMTAGFENSTSETSAIQNNSHQNNLLQNNVNENMTVAESQPGFESAGGYGQIQSQANSQRQEHGYVSHESHQSLPDTDYIQPLQPVAQPSMQNHGGINDDVPSDYSGNTAIRGYNSVLNQTGSNLHSSNQHIEQATHNYSDLMTVPVGNAHCASTNVMVVDGIGILVSRENQFYLIRQSVLLKNDVKSALKNAVSQPLLLPVAIILERRHSEKKDINVAAANGLEIKSSEVKPQDAQNADTKNSDTKNFDIKKLVKDNLLPITEQFSLVMQLTGNKLILKQVPAGTRNQNWQQIMTDIIEYLPFEDNSVLVDVLAKSWIGSSTTEKLWQELAEQTREQLISESGMEVPLKEWLQDF